LKISGSQYVIADHENRLSGNLLEM
jgi:hypothetical protein